MTVIWINNTNTVELDKLTNAEDGSPISAGYSVTITLRQGGLTVAGPVSLTLVPGSANTWRGRVAHSVVLTHRGRYDMQAIADNPGAGVRGEWNDVVTAMLRGAQ